VDRYVRVRYVDALVKFLNDLAAVRNVRSGARRLADSLTIEWLHIVGPIFAGKRPKMLGVNLGVHIEQIVR
jgi:predicted RecB family endonuclease